MHQAVHQFQQGDLDGAEKTVIRVLNLNTKEFHALHIYGIILALKAKPLEAIKYLKKALLIAPELAVMRDLAKVQFQIGRYADALDTFRRILALTGSAADTLMDIGTVLHKLGRSEEALKSYDEALTLDPQYAEAWSKRGRLLREQKHYQQALLCFDKLISIKPDDVNAWLDRSDVFLDQQFYAEALASAEKAVAMHPGCVDGWLNMGLSLHFLERHDEAVVAYRKLLSLDSGHAEAWSNLSSVFAHAGQFDDALASLAKARLYTATPAEITWNESLIRLLLGQFRPGWEQYEARKFIAEPKAGRYRDIPPLPNLASLRGKKLLVWHEQGFGDTLQFARFVPLLAGLGAEVTFEVQPALKTVLSDAGEGVRVIETPVVDGQAFDFQTPLLSLPYLFEVDLDSIPGSPGEICIGESKLAHWQARIAASSRPKVGIACSGNPRHKSDAQRSVALAAFAPLCDIADLYLIQKDVRDSDQAALAQSGIAWLGPELHDFEDTAAAVRQMDLVISVDTSLVHLAGAMDKEVWILLAATPDWRWLLDRNDSPWYASARLFRQPSRGDWQSVFSDVRKALQAERGGDGPHGERI